MNHRQELPGAVQPVDKIRGQHEVVACMQAFQIACVGLLEGNPLLSSLKAQIGQFHFMVGDELTLLNPRVSTGALLQQFHANADEPS